MTQKKILRFCCMRYIINRFHSFLSLSEMAKRKLDWNTIYSKNIIHCNETGCSYSTKIDQLKDHMIKKHRYGNFACTYSNCSYVGFSQVRSLKYGSIHNPYPQLYDFHTFSVRSL